MNKLNKRDGDRLGGEWVAAGSGGGGMSRKDRGLMDSENSVVGCRAEVGVRRLSGNGKKI